LTTY